MFLSNSSLILLIILLISTGTLIGYLVSVYHAVNHLPQVDLSKLLDENDISGSRFPLISVIVPAFNEEENIEDCIRSIMSSTRLSRELLEICVVDDQSTDRTFEILQTLITQWADARLKLISGRSRPEGQLWNGKNWACHQGSEQAKGDFLLFIDADVRLKPRAIVAVVSTAIANHLDFLTCIPTIVSGSLIEWLVQPLMFINVLVAFNSKAVKDPKTKTTYALGPFLLFRADAYRAMGGHKAVAADIAEDVAFARKAKHDGFRTQQLLGENLATLRMYRNWYSLWEGWTKVLYVGADRSVPLMVLLATVMLLIYTIPWVGFFGAIAEFLTHPTILHLTTIGLASLAILLQYWVRLWGSQALGTSTKYWWLQSVGGVIIAILAIASIIKTETGWGWTWRGRKLTSSRKV